MTGIAEQAHGPEVHGGRTSIALACALRARVLVLALLFFVGIAPGAWAEGLGVSTFLPTGASGGVIGGDTVAAPQTAGEVRGRIEARARQLAGPEMRAERRESRLRYGGMRGRDALDVGKRFFSVLTGPSWRPADEAPGVRPLSYLDDHTVRVEDGRGSRTALLVSEAPFWVEDRNGDTARMATDLRDEGDRLVSANPLVETEISRDPEQGVRFPEHDVVVAVASERPVGGETVASAERVTYLNVETDTDLSVSSIPNGVQTHHVLRSVTAPDELGMRLTLPDGAGLVEADHGGLMIVRDGEQIGEISAPLAVDAQHQQVPSRLRTTDGGVVVEVDHRGGDFAYPILVDPNFVLDSGPDPSPGGLPNQGWGFHTPWPHNYDWDFDGQAKYLYSDGGVNFSPGEWGWWEYDPPHLQSGGQGFVYKANYYNTSHSGDYSCATFGIYNRATLSWVSGSHSVPGWGGNAGPFDYCYAFAGKEVYVCADGLAHVDFGQCWGGAPNQQTAMQLRSVGGAGLPAAQVAAGSTSVYLRDNDDPTVTPGAVPGNGSWTNQRNAYGRLAFSMTASDPGLGLRSLKIGYAGTAPQGTALGCGAAAYPCQRDDTHSYEYEPVEGEHDAVFTATDAVDHTPEPVRRKVRFDRSGPAVKFTGSLAARSTRAQVFQGPVPWPDWARYEKDTRALAQKARLTVEVTDGDPTNRTGAAARAGVERVTFKLLRHNGTRNVYPTGSWDSVSTALPADDQRSSCPENSCPAEKREWVMDPETLAPGLYAFEVRSWDFAANSVVAYQVFRVAARQLDTVAEGQRSSRYVTLRVKPPTGGSGPDESVVFEYRANGGGWASLPTSMVKQGPLEPVTSWPVATSKTVVWDIAREYTGDIYATGSSDDAPTPANAGIQAYKPFEVRARFPNATSTLDDDPISEELRLEYDPSGDGTGNDRKEVGPGSVDLQTGAFSLTEDDVAVDAFLTDLKVTRTYNSRGRPQTGSAEGPLGPGWILGSPSIEGSEYQKIVYEAATEQNLPYEDDSGDSETVAEPGYAVVTSGDGSEIVFQQAGDDSGAFVPEPGVEGLRLTRTQGAPDAPTEFELTDYDTQERFTFVAGTSKTFELRAVRSLGTGAKDLTYRWESIGGKRVLTRVSAPAGPGIGDCGAPIPAVGCRQLQFNYWDGRLMSIFYSVEGIDDPWPIARYEYDAQKRLASARDQNGLTTRYTYADLSEPAPPEGCTSQVPSTHTVLKTVDPPGSELPWTLDYQRNCTDKDLGRLSSVSRPALAPAAGSAVTRVEYEVPRSTADGGPWDMRPSTLAVLGQTDVPIDGTAVFPADVTDTSDRTNATISYLNGQGRSVNTVLPGPSEPRVSTTEYDKYGNPIRSLTPENRRTALAASDPTAEARALSTERAFETNEAGSRLVWELGPRHEVRVPGRSGTFQARKHTTVTYDEGRPTGNTDYNFATTTRVAALTEAPNYASLAAMGPNDLDERVTKAQYDFTKRVQTERIVDPDGQNLRTTTAYDAQGLVIEERMPRNPDGGDASARKTVYYTADASAPVSRCRNNVHWAGFVCQHAPAAQPGTSQLPQLPVTTYEYDTVGQVTKETDTVEGDSPATRTTTTQYAGIGRPSRVSTRAGSGDGAPVMDLDVEYDPATGRVVAQRSKDPDTGNVVAEILKRYDDLGRLESYTDADGLQTATRYDIRDRPTRVSDPKQGERTMTYAPRAGDLVEVTDPALGNAAGEPSLRGEYDLDGRLVSQVYTKANLRLDIGYDETGDQAIRRYTKMVGCTASCEWNSSEAEHTIHGQWFKHATRREGLLHSSQIYTYDGAGRLLDARDSLGGQCTVRLYRFDDDAGKNSNRTRQVTRSPLSSGACNEQSGSGTTTDLTYDAADRITGSGFVYDAFGRITSVPAQHAGGAQLDAKYYVNDLAREIQQSGKRTEIELDPADRVRKRTVSGSESYTEVSHYDGDGDEPAFTERGTDISREIEGLDGDLAAVHTTKHGAMLQLTNLHGDVVAEAINDPATVRPDATWETDEFGAPKAGSGPITKVGSERTALTDPATSVTITKPPGTQKGDLMIAQIAAGANATITKPTGWVNAAGVEVSNGGIRYRLYYKAAGASEPASYDFGFSASAEHIGAINTVRNAAKVNPFNATSTATGSTVQIKAPSVTPTKNDSAILAFGGMGIGDNDGGHAWGGLANPLFPRDWSIATGPTSDDQSALTKSGILVGGKSQPTGEIVSSRLSTLPAEVWAAVTVAITAANPTPTQQHYSYLGGKQRHTSTSTGVIEMGARVYVPQLGRFLQTDPVYRGSANAYDYVHQDAVNNLDLDGLICTQKNRDNGSCFDRGAAEQNKKKNKKKSKKKKAATRAPRPSAPARQRAPRQPRPKPQRTVAQETAHRCMVGGITGILTGGAGGALAGALGGGPLGAIGGAAVGSATGGVGGCLANATVGQGVDHALP